MTPAGDAVHAAIADLGVPFRFERSIKLHRGHVDDDRFVVSVEPRHLARGGDGSANIGACLTRLGFPARAAEWLRRFQHGAVLLHLGHEASAQGLTRKIYLDYAAALADPLSDARADGAGTRREGAIVHRALKFDVASGLLRDATYRLAPRALIEVGPLATGTAAALARELIQRAAPLDLADAPVLLDVVEQETTRRYFDLQFHGLALRLSDWRDGVSRLEQTFALPHGRIAASIQNDATLGHLAGGDDGSGRPFATLYFGARWR